MKSLQLYLLHEDGLTHDAASKAGLEPLAAEDEGEAVGGRRVIRRRRTLANLTSVKDKIKVHIVSSSELLQSIFIKPPTQTKVFWKYFETIYMIHETIYVGQRVIILNNRGI